MNNEMCKTSAYCQLSILLVIEYRKPKLEYRNISIKVKISTNTTNRKLSICVCNRENKRTKIKLINNHI